MQWNHFQSEQLRTESWEIFANFYHFSREIVRRYGNFPAWYWCHLALTGKVDYVYQCNETVLKVDKFRKIYEKSLRTFTTFRDKSCVAMATIQRDIHSIRLQPERLLTPTDCFYSYQGNETIFKVENFRQSYVELSYHFWWEIVRCHSNFSAWYSFHRDDC